MIEPASSERIQRVRIGLTGLALVFLLVLLGTAVSRSSEDSSVPRAEANLSVNDSVPDEPLAELGVAPGQSTTDNAAVERAAEAAPPR
ncbi:MAG: hypothetical protein M3Q57_10265 [Pseudomonadota bacterium]|nr:hypothetical protein [Pseudomonadota bacterium]